MIFSSLYTIKEKLNQHLKRRAGTSEDLSVLNNIIDLDGGVSMKSNNKVSVTLVNIKREMAAGHQQRSQYSNIEKISSKYPPLHINMYVLFSANFNENYEEALKYISEVLAFFQANQIFNHQNSPELNTKIEKLTIEIVDMDFQELSQLWGVLGGKYIPSVLYKIRMVSIDSDEIISDLPMVKGINIDLNSNENG